MNIDSVQLALPSLQLTNDEILDEVRRQSEPVFVGDLDVALRRVCRWLKYSGAKMRHRLAEGETPIDVLSRAVRAALEEAGCGKEDIDLLVYVGVGRGFIEPAAAYLVAHALGMKHVHCFDVLDACNSWSRATQLVQSLLQTTGYRRAMIVNAEFTTSANGLGNYALTSVDDLAWTFPTYTIGEAATATILSREPDRPWRFRFASRPDLADLCTIPVRGYEGYCRGTERIGRNGHMFASYGVELFEAAGPELLRIFRDLDVPVADLTALFPHAASQKASDDLADILGIRHLVYNVYPRCGNVVSCSVPAAMALAIREERVQRGDRLAAVVASAGMSFAAYSFLY